MKKFKKFGFIFALLVLLVGGVSLTGGFSFASASNSQNLYSGQIANQVIFVTFEDGNENWLNSSVPNYTQSPLTLMKNSYNDSNSSVENYYKIQSYNSLDLKSYFITNGEKAVKVPYTKNQLLPYSKTNTAGYLEYEICSYSSSYAPSQLSLEYFLNTTHLFSCYDCGNATHNGRGTNCDLDYSDDIACLCAYYDYKSNNSKVCQYENLERYFREQYALRTVLNNVNFVGNLDNNNDGLVDAITFIFEGISEDVGWSELLWAHQSAVVNLSAYISASYKSMLPAILSARKVRDASEADFSNKLDVLFTNPSQGGKTCFKYNLYLFSHLLLEVKNEVQKMTGNDGKEVISNFTLTHELGHVLGLPDYYVYDENDEREDAVDAWDLMSYSYKGVPTYMLTYNREKLGFLTSQNVVKLTSEGTYELYSTCHDEIANGGENSGNVLAYVYEDDAHPGQKFYFEYRMQEGLFDSGLANSIFVNNRQDGLIVYRVDENIKQVEGYDTSLSSGNFYGYPYNIYVFRNSNGVFALNQTNTVINNITFQSYNSSLNQGQLTYEDVTFSNSGLSIEFVSIEAGKLSFKISGGDLEKEDTRDFSQIKLNGNSTVTIEVKSSYVDGGVDFGDFSQNEFDVTIDNKVNTSHLGTYTYTYRLVLKKDKAKVVTIARTVRVVDTTNPTVTLKGENSIVVGNLSDYVESGINYSDNYDTNANLTVVISDFIFVSDNHYKITYTVTDTSGNFTQIERFVSIRPKTDFSSVVLIGGAVVHHEVGSAYTDGGVNFGVFSESDFTINIENNVVASVINQNGGHYTYVYNLIYKATGECFALTRQVVVEDTTSPLVSLIGGNLTLSKLSAFDDDGVDKGVNYSDNYNEKASLRLVVGRPVKVSENYYKVIYTVTDLSGNSASVERFITINPNLFSGVTLKGEKIVSHNVKTVYNDEGLIFGSFAESDFKVVASNGVNENVITSQKEYIYSYTLTYLLSGEILTFERTVYVVDRVAPTIKLLGNTQVEIYPSQLGSYNDTNVEVADNYNSKNEISIITRLAKVDEKTYLYYYKAKDKSGNESEEVCRKLVIKSKPLISSQIEIKIDNSTTIKEKYVQDKQIKFNINIAYNQDNAQNQRIKFIVDGQVINENCDPSFTYSFNAGTHKVRIEVGESAYCEKTIFVAEKESNEKSSVDNILVYVLAGCGVGMILFSIISIIITKKNRLKELDRY